MSLIDGVAATLLERYGLRAARVERVAHLDVDVYRVRPHAADQTKRSQGDLAWRVYRGDRQDRGAIADECVWLQTLAEAGVAVPWPITGLDGEAVQRVDPPLDNGSSTPRFAVLLTWVPGRFVEKGLRPVHLRRLGTLAAQLHASAEALVVLGSLRSQRLANLPDLEAWARRHVPASPHLKPAVHEAVCRAAAVLRNHIAALPKAPSSYGYLHGDLHLWNVLFQGDHAGAIDFSDCGRGHHALDLACVLQYIRHPLPGRADHGAQHRRLRDALLDGYARVRALPADVERQIDLYIAARMIGTIEWILDDWPRPDHRAWGPPFLDGAATMFEGLD